MMMLWRVIVYFVVVGLLVWAAVFLANHPGQVSIDWRGFRVDTSVGILVLALAALVGVSIALYRLVRAVLTAPGGLLRYRRDSRQKRGYQAVTRGMVALAAGDPDEARRQARRANGLLKDPPLTQLLLAQSAQLSGDEAAASRYFNSMTENKDAALLGVRGLLNQALRAGDVEEALRLAKKADSLRPDVPWVQAALADLYLQREDWDAAADRLQRAVRLKALPAEEAKVKRAQVTGEQAAAAEATGDVKTALARAEAAVKLAPDSVKATAAWIRLLGKAGKTRKAEKMAIRAWETIPHEDLARAFIDLKPETTSLEQLKRVQTLCRANPDHPESRMAQAEASLHARLWGQVRHYLEPLVADDVEAPARACRLMAAVEKAEHGNLVAAEQWWARAEGIRPNLPVGPIKESDTTPVVAEPQTA